MSTTLVAALDPRLNGMEAAIFLDGMLTPVDDSGSYLEDCAIKEARDYATSHENAEKLWKLSEELVGQKFDV